jgi:hypothetical protein
MATENTARLAVLIDADNAQPSITEGLLAEVAKYGTAHGEDTAFLAGVHERLLAVTGAVPLDLGQRRRVDQVAQLALA